MRCDRCRHGFAQIQSSPHHVSQVYGDDYFCGGKDGYDDYSALAESKRKSGHDIADTLAKWMKPASVLSVGAANGTQLQGMLDRGWSGAGLEPNASMVAQGRQLGLEMHHGTLEECNLETAFDLVTMVQVAPHFFNLNQAFAKAGELTIDGGYWYIETWDWTSLMAKSFGRYWHEYSPPSVLHWFSKPSLTAIANNQGMEPVAFGRPKKSITLNHARSLLEHTLGGSRLAKIALSPLQIFPKNSEIPYPSFDLFWGLYRKTR